MSVVEDDGGALVSTGLESLIGGPVIVRWAEGADRRAAEELLAYIRNVIETSGKQLRAGDTIRFGMWAVTLMPQERERCFELWEYDLSGTSLVEGCALALKFARQQRAICSEYLSEFVPPLADELMGVDPACLRGGEVEGGRYLFEPPHSGWILLSPSRDFSRVVNEHGYHVIAARPDIVPFLALGHGYRFYISGNAKEVSFDQSLLEI